MLKSPGHVRYESLQKKCHGRHAVNALADDFREYTPPRSRPEFTTNSLIGIRWYGIWEPWTNRGTVLMDAPPCAILLIFGLATRIQRKALIGYLSSDIEQDLYATYAYQVCIYCGFTLVLGQLL